MINFVNNLVSFLKGETVKAVMDEFRVAILVCSVLLAAALVVFLLRTVFHYLLMYKGYSAFDQKHAGPLLVLSFFCPPAAAVIWAVFGFGRQYELRGPVYQAPAPLPQTIEAVQTPSALPEAAPAQETLSVLPEAVPAEEIPDPEPSLEPIE